MALPNWIERFELSGGPDYSGHAEFFSIRMFRNVIDRHDGYDRRILGYIDWCCEDRISKIEIVSMGKALGLEDDDFFYCWIPENTEGHLRRIEIDLDVITMSRAVGPTRIVNVEARLALNDRVVNTDVADADYLGEDSDINDSDYDFNEDEDHDNEQDMENEENFEPAAPPEPVVPPGADNEYEAVEHEGQVDCPSSEYAGSEELHSCSDSDNEGSSKSRFPDFWEENMGDPRFEIGMIFKSFKQFKEAVRNYGIKNRYVINFKPNNKQRCKAICKKGCPFYLWSSLISKDNPTIQIKNGILSHSCSRDHNIRHVNTKWISLHYLEQFRADPTWKLEGIMQAVRENQKADISKMIAYRAKKAAMLIINGDETEQFNMLYDYRLELLRTHPTSTVMFKQDNCVFKGMYVCLAPLRDGFKDGCRRVISVDGCWPKGLYGGQLLTAVGIDANDCIYPIAWAVVDGETKENWLWFLELLGQDLEINQSTNWAFMSDRQKV
ncbi:uncharacterized protein LOC126654895 [Mercurialis annua]|uniref:uncharacterized protein LOC126654895 n=1 Tax=Mercurialis annua TaxID=3986 RepID=UPI00215F8E4B|nr:uncharacterized protein LOC126654895 [Mercurialis annua]